MCVVIIVEWIIRWGCELSEKLSRRHKIEEGENRVELAVYKLKYVALDNNANYSEETSSEVCFLGETSLYDIEYDKVLKWRTAASGMSEGAGSTRNPVLVEAVKRFTRENKIENFEKRNMLEHLEGIKEDEVISIPLGKTKEASETVRARLYVLRCQC